MTRYPLCRRLDRPQCQSGQVQKISPPLGFNPWAVQPVVSRYTDCTIPAHNSSCRIFIISFADSSSDTASLDSIFNFIQYLHPNSRSSGVLYVKTGAASS